MKWLLLVLAVLSLLFPLYVNAKPLASLINLETFTAVLAEASGMIPGTSGPVSVTARLLANGAGIQLMTYTVNDVVMIIDLAPQDQEVPAWIDKSFCPQVPGRYNTDAKPSGDFILIPDCPIPQPGA